MLFNIMKKYTITVTGLLENSFWINLFERNDNEVYAVAGKIFSREPTDKELYDFVLTNFYNLNLKSPKISKLVVKRKILSTCNEK
ncbi:DUF2992 family protein [Candidatus Coxiella mudrowiae]|uniref:DUF2992 family protein n=1 Tax=Candidatus Coxiella mudrowiae TaxID=2054173 RepID=UPI000C29077A